MSEIYCYLLGAGASCNALPLVKQIPERLRAFNDSLSEWSQKVGSPTNVIRSATEDLLEQVGKHASIDTYAKKLFLKRDREGLKKLKAITSCFFVYEQTLKPVDKRYDIFLASIIKIARGSAIELPANIKIVTWNYDTQLEKAFYGFCDNEDFVENKITFNKNVERLNGYCGTLIPGHLGPEYKVPWKGTENEAINTIIKLYGDYMNPENSIPADINFAWETQADMFSRNITLILKDVTILVIIGYSFPFFNREIDRIILDKLSLLKKIYVQVPEDFHVAIEERLIALKPDLSPRIYLKDTSSFYIPYEYE